MVSLNGTLVLFSLQKQHPVSLEVDEWWSCFLACSFVFGWLHVELLIEELIEVVQWNLGVEYILTELKDEYQRLQIMKVCPSLQHFSFKHVCDDLERTLNAIVEVVTCKIFTWVVEASPTVDKESWWVAKATLLWALYPFDGCIFLSNITFVVCIDALVCKDQFCILWNSWAC